ncbi:histidine phosphatase family protein [Candidatus Enterococcus mansonii]|uniref:Phosphoglycerate mutase n=1 Tax=Candidatus Enterococcus mansonii TaxID=1834181 RepID=A0A242CC78_9ENTE|nr:histidine phosphatase family protein [Enterococcus sp. 4G2_DIV0659]OTO07769.1 hypothetical protein A5880_002039 [Enterococcus sp. 4G2_DIV0659]
MKSRRYGKKLSIFVAIVLMFGLLSGCNSNEQQGKSESEQAQKTEDVTIYLTRHGETMFNIMNKVQGWSDTPLTEEGEKVAADLGKGLAQEKITFSAAYSSDLKRAFDTATIVLANTDQKKLEIQQNKQLREPNYGGYEGEFIDKITPELAAHNGFETGKEFQASAGKMYWNKLADTYQAMDTYKLAENAESVEKRMEAELLAIAKEQSQKGGGNVLVVSHGMAINIMLSKLSSEYEGKPLKNASVTKIVYKDGQLNVLSIGDVSYFEKGQKKE